MSLGSKELFHSDVLAYLLSSSKIQNKNFTLKQLLGIKFNEEIFHIFREGKHFDIVVVYGNSDQKDFKAIVLENKLKAIPEKNQFSKYDEKIKNGKIKLTFSLEDESKHKQSIVLTSKNTKKILFAPNLTLEYAKKILNLDNWNPFSYETYLSALKNEFADSNLKKSENDIVIKKYAEMLDVLIREIINGLLAQDLENPKIIPNKNNLTLLKEIRIADLYEKLWYAFCLSKINEKLKINSKNLYDYTAAGFTDGTGFFDWKIKMCGEEIYAGVQIKKDSFRISVEPNFNNGKKSFQKNGAEILDGIKNWELDILDSLDSGKKLLGEVVNRKNAIRNLGTFKYMHRKIKIDNSLEGIVPFVAQALLLIKEKEFLLCKKLGL